MIYILLSIFFFTGIFLIFKIIGKKNLPTLNIIVINYFVAAILGNIQSSENPINAFSQDWIYMAIIIGLLFFIFFIVLGISAKLVGLSITTVAGKMSVVIPIIFSIIYYKENVSILKTSGIILAVLGVLFTVYKKTEETKKHKLSEFLIPLLLFIGMGFTDLLFKFSQHKYINENNIALFNSSLFYISFFSSLIYALFSKNHQSFFKKETILYGILLGAVNYLGVLFFIKALGTNIFDSSVIFGINNIGIVILSVLLGLVLFKEKLSSINLVGVSISIAAIFMLSLS